MPIAAKQSKAIFLDAVRNVPVDRWTAFVEEACEGDVQLAGQVQRLLQAHLSEKALVTEAVGSVAAKVPAMSGEQIGTLIGPYKLLEQIGEGGMGLVYVAEQTEPVRRKVALKLIKPGMDTRQVIARFEAERQALAMMDHPNIARVFDAGTTGRSRQTPSAVAADDGTRSVPATEGRPYFVMELIRGLPITDYCDKARLDPRQRLKLLIDVCHAVQHAHQKGIIHRDLKPSNVMVTLHDGTPVVKVIDFGVAKAIGAQLTERTIYTAHAQLVGTPLYMSPEQAELSGLDVDTRSDVYSLGVLLYELLTGQTPFDKETLSRAGFDEMRRIIREDEPPRPSHRVSTLNAEAITTVSQHRGLDQRRLSQSLRGELDWIIMKALEKDRSHRYESASTFAADIQRYLSDEPVQACPPSALYRFRKFARKHKTAITTASLLVATLLLGTGISLWQAVRATAAEAQATAKEAQAKEATAAEVKQRERAEASEQKALAAASAERAAKEAEAAQRKLVQTNLARAIEAVDRLLEHVGDPDLNDTPRVGPLRRKMLKDAIAFYERVPLQSVGSDNVRFRVAQTWSRIAHLSWRLDELQQADRAFSVETAALAELSDRNPGQAKYRVALADSHNNTGLVNASIDLSKAEKALQKAIELYAELARDDPQALRWLNRQAMALCELSRTLSRLGKRDEALATCTRAVELLDQSPATTDFDRGQILTRMGFLQATRSESDECFRRAVAAFREYFSQQKRAEGNREQYAGKLWSIAGHFSRHDPALATQLYDESVSLWKEIVGPSPDRRGYLLFLTFALADSGRHQRRLAAEMTNAESAEQRLRTAKMGDGLFQEALQRQRQLVSLFVVVEDRHRFVQMLQEQSEYLLGPLAATAAAQPDDPAARKLQADALLTEAIQLCRALTAEFPDNAEYKTRLTELLNIQANHFGPKSEQPKEETAK